MKELWKTFWICIIYFSQSCERTVFVREL